MPPTLPPLARDLLEALLDRLERPGRQTVARVTLDAQTHAGYFENAQTRLAVNEVLQELAAGGIIVVHFVRHQEHLIDKIDLVPEQANELYARLRRTPRADAETAVRQLLDRQLPGADWCASFLARCRDQLAAHKSISPLRLGDDDHNRALLGTLVELSQLSEPTLERVFSVRVLHDSKRFEDLRGDVVRVLRQFSPQAGALGDDDRALLAAHYIERVPEYVQLAGALTLEVANARCECAPFQPSLALPASLLRRARVADIGDISVVLTIENATSFDEFCRVRPPKVLAVFTGGFASPTVIRLLQQLRDHQRLLRLHHWGDLDAGGLRILRHLRQHLGEVGPVLMAAPTLLEYRAQAQPLTAADRAGLEALRADLELADMQSLIDAQLECGCKLEQEAIPIARAIQVLNRQANPPKTSAG